MKGIALEFKMIAAYYVFKKEKVVRRKKDCNRHSVQASSHQAYGNRNNRKRKRVEIADGSIKTKKSFRTFLTEFMEKHAS